MSNNYYAGNVIYNNQHKELTIQGNLSAQQMMKIAKDFFAVLSATCFKRVLSSSTASCVAFII